MDTKDLMAMTAEKPHTTPELVDFNDVNIGDELVFSTRDSGFGGRGTWVERTGIVTAKTTATITLKVIGNNPFVDHVYRNGKARDLGYNARLLRSAWCDRSVRRTKKADQIPYNADHVHIIDEGHTLTAIWIADPEKAKNPRATYDAPPTYENRDDYEVIAEATRFYKAEGAYFSGWIVRDATGNHDTMPLPNKKAAMRGLKSTVDEYFNR